MVDKTKPPVEKTDPRHPDTAADRDPTSPASYGVHEKDPELSRTFGFSTIEVPDDLHDPKPGEGPREPVRMPSVVGLGDTMRERKAAREKGGRPAGTQTTTVDPGTVTTK